MAASKVYDLTAPIQSSNEAPRPGRSSLLLLLLLSAALLVFLLVILGLVAAIFVKVNKTASSSPQASTPAPASSAPTTSASSEQTTSGSGSTSSGGTPITTAPPTPGWHDAAQVILEAMNQSASPCDDFFAFSCGGWIAKNPIPPSAATYSIYDRMQQDILNEVRAALSLIDIRSPKAPEALRKARIAFDTCNNSRSAQIRHSSALLDTLANLGGWPIIEPDWPAGNFNPYVYMGQLIGEFGLSTLLSAGSTVQLTDASLYILEIAQGSLILARPYYFNDSFTNASHDFQQSVQDAIDAYKATIKNISLILAEEAGYDWIHDPGHHSRIEQEAEEIFAFEQQLARIIVPDEDMRNYTLLWNPITVGEAISRWGDVEFDKFLTALLPAYVSIRHDDTINVAQPHYLDQLVQLLLSVERRVVYNYLGWRLVYSLGDFIDPDIQRQYLALKRKVDFVEELPLPPDACAGTIVNTLGYAAGRLFVQNYFERDENGSREAVSNMTQQIIDSLATMISGLNWFHSKEKAQTKISQVVQNIAWPDWIFNDTLLDRYYDSLKIKEADSWFRANQQLSQFAAIAQFRQLGKPVDRRDFQMSPAIVNAWYAPEYNSITIPAGILLPPMFRTDYPKAINFGCTGNTIGHEMTHGFDDEGTQFYANGTLYNWIDPESQASFAEMAQCVVNEYNRFCPPEFHNNLCLNGETNQGENIADNGGMREAYLAYCNWVKQYNGGQEEQRLPGLESYSMEQIYFISYGLSWCGHDRPEYVEKLIWTNPHSPGKYRVLGVMQNFDPFAKAFHCPAPTQLEAGPVEKCNVWANKQPTPGHLAAAQTIIDAVDETQDPCEDFFAFACGRWNKAHSANVSFTESIAGDVAMGVEQRMARLLFYNLSSADPSLPSAVRKAKLIFDKFYAQYNHSSSTKQSNYDAVKVAADELMRQGGWPMITADWDSSAATPVSFFIGQARSTYGINTIIPIDVDIDLLDVSRYTVFVELGVTSLFPNPPLQSVPWFGEARKAKKSGAKPALQFAARTVEEIVAVAKQIANASKIDIDAKLNASMYADAQILSQLIEQLLDVVFHDYTIPNATLNYHKFSLKTLASRHKLIQWDLFLSGLRPDMVVSDTFELVFLSIACWDSVDKLLSQASVRTLFNLVYYIFADSMTRNAPGKAAGGRRGRDVPYDESAALDSVAKTILYAEHAVSRVYNDFYYNSNTKPDIDTLMPFVLQGLEQMLTSLDWLDDASRQAASRKAQSVVYTAAYQQWVSNDAQLDRFYADLDVDVDDTVADIQRKGAIFIAKSLLQLITKVVDRHDNGGMPAYIMNAWYQPEMNSITIGSGILQSPFYRHDFPKLVNFARIGSILGHELSHGFDNSGIKWDWNGTYHQVIDQQTMDHGFANMSTCVVDQYNNFCFSPNHTDCVNGRLSEGENIADSGGLREAYLAWQRWMATQCDISDSQLPGLENYSAEQLFFMAYATPYCEYDDPSAYGSITEQVHSPGRFRVNGPLQNFALFGKAFQCKLGQPMFPKEHCYVWSNPALSKAT